MIAPTAKPFARAVSAARATCCRSLARLIPIVGLAACGDAPPPADLMCPEVAVAALDAVEVSQGRVMTPEEAQVFGMGAMFADRIQQTAPEPAPADLQAPRAAPPPLPRIDVAILSAGGQFGAFTAGFMNGWSENRVEPRPRDFDVVTGVSTGALLAPFVFAGRDYDQALKEVYDGVRERDILRRRRPLELIAAPSLWDPRPLSDLIERYLQPALIDRLAAASEDRTLLVGSVNVGTGFFEAFDVTSLAASDNPQKVDCLRETLLASAAIPVAFPPRRLNGAFYVDGAARQGLFLRGLAGARVQPDIYMFLNNAASFPTDAPGFRLGPLAGRTTEILSDELLRNSAEDTVQFAKSQGWRVRGMFVPDIWPGDDCEIRNGQKASFCESFTRALYAEGFRIGSSGRIPWLDADDLLERLQTFRSVAR